MRYWEVVFLVVVRSLFTTVVSSRDKILMTTNWLKQVFEFHDSYTFSPFLHKRMTSAKKPHWPKNWLLIKNVPFTRNHYYGTGFCKARGHTVTDECPKGTSHVTEWRVLCRTSSVIMISCKRHSQIHSIKLRLSYAYFKSIWLKTFAKFQSFLI